MMRVVFLCAGLMSVAAGGALLGSTGGNTAEKSLRNAMGIAVDSSGAIYVAILGEDVVQVYDSSGEFKRLFSVDAGLGGFHLRMRAEDVLEVTTYRTRMVYRFDSAGKLLSAEKVKHVFYPTDITRFGTAKTLSGIRYALRPRDRAIIKIDPDGTESRFVEQSWWPWALAGAFPPLMVTAVGATHLIIAATMRESWLRLIMRASNDAE